MNQPKKETIRSQNKSYLKEILIEVNKCIEHNVSRAIRNINNAEIIPFLQYAIEVKKDYDRALMIRLGYEVTGENWRNAIPAMICAELLDFSICVIDDILDISNSRLGKPAFFKKWDIRYALNVSLILKCLATEILFYKSFLKKISNHKLLKIIHLFERAHREVYEGQFLDVKFEEIPFENVTQEMYLRMIRHTSGAQGAAYCQIGGIIADANQKEIEALEKYGMYMGMIFQIRDDFIDYINNEDGIGKPPFRDFLQKKRRLPMILGWQKFSQSEKKLLMHLANKNKLSEIQKKQVLSIILKDNVIKNSKRIVNKFKEEAINALGVFPENNKGKKALIELIELGASL